MTSPAMPLSPHHSRAATTMVRPSRKKPMPSRRCSGSSALALRPIRRTVPPATWAMPIQVPRTALTGHGRSPRRALALDRDDLAAGLRRAGRPLRPLAGLDEPARPEDFGRATGEDVRLDTVRRLRERHSGITRHTRSGEHQSPPTTNGHHLDRESLGGRLGNYASMTIGMI